MATARDNYRRILAENGVGDPGGDLHSWRCRQYGPCDCLDSLLDDLVAVEAPTEALGYIDKAIDNMSTSLEEGDRTPMWSNQEVHELLTEIRNYITGAAS